MRVVPNLYPALARQEVVVHTPHHTRSFAELSHAEAAVVAEAWRLRAAAADAEGFPYLHALVNEGRFAGASLAHSHSQLVWLREPPPAVGAERAQAGEGGCTLCELLARERAERVRTLAEAGGFLMTAAYAGRLPYELLIAGEHSGGSAFETGGALEAALGLLADGLRALRAIEGPVPVNAWLHDGEHWHIEVLPRLSVLAGLELGAGIYVNTLAPEEAAARLRGAVGSLG